MKQLETVKRQIGNHVYGCRKLPAGIGLRVGAKLLNLLGPSIKGMGEEENSLNGIVSELLSNEELAGKLEFFCQTFAAHSTLETGGQSIELAGIFDVHFAGEYFDLLQWLLFCFEVNHKSFLERAGISMASMVAKVQAGLSSKSPKGAAKPGLSGASSSPADLTKPT